MPTKSHDDGSVGATASRPTKFSTGSKDIRVSTFHTENQFAGLSFGGGIVTLISEIAHDGISDDFLFS